MSVEDNFDKILYSTLWTIDKVVHSDTVTIVNDGATLSSQVAKIQDTVIENPLSRLCYARAAWSLDNTNWNSIHTRDIYLFTSNYNGMFGSFSQSLNGLKAAVSIGCSNSQVIIRTANGFHGDVSSDDVSESYTPTSLTFYVRYALFEVE